MTEGELIKRFRERVGWKRGELALQIGVDYHRIRDWELGVCTPRYWGWVNFGELLAGGGGYYDLWLEWRAISISRGEYVADDNLDNGDVTNRREE